MNKPKLSESATSSQSQLLSLQPLVKSKKEKASKVVKIKEKKKRGRTLKFKKGSSKTVNDLESATSSDGQVASPVIEEVQVVDAAVVTPSRGTKLS
jgi:hypothetical protein